MENENILDNSEKLQFNDSLILRCPKCKLIPYFKIDFLNNTLEYKCPNNHYEKDEIKIIYNKLKINKISNDINCCQCSNKAGLYCSECGNFFCKNEIDLEKNKKNHLLINIENIDNYCFKDNQKYAIYCKTHNISLCADCDHKDDNCEIIRLNQLNISNEIYEKYSEKLLDFKNKHINDNKKNIEILENLINLLNSYINKLKEIEENIKNNYHYLFLDNLLNSYLYKKNNKCYNYNIFNNIYENFKNDFELNINNDFSFIFKELNDKLKQIQNDYCDDNKNINNKIINEQENQSISTLLNENISIISNLNQSININDNVFKTNIIGNNIIQLNDSKDKIENKLNDSNDKKENQINESKNNQLLNCVILKKINKINYNNIIYSMKVLKDKRLAVGGKSSILYIISKNNYNIDLTVNNNKEAIYKIKELKNNNIILTFNSGDMTIIEVKQNNFKFIQKFEKAHNEDIYNIIELKNSNNLISCSLDKSLKIWSYDNQYNEYKEIFKIDEDCEILNILEIKENEIIYDNFSKKTIKFYNIKDKKLINQINNLELIDWNNNFVLINNKVLIGGNKKIYFIDINSYTKEKEINFDNSIYSIKKFKDNLYMIGDEKGNISSFDINNCNLKVIKNKIHKKKILAMVKFDGKLVSGGSDNLIKFTKIQLDKK